MRFPVKKCLCLLLASVLACACLSGCFLLKGKKPAPHKPSGGSSYKPTVTAAPTADPADALPQVDWEAVIRADLYGQDSPLSRAMGEAVTLSAAQTEVGVITVTVTAPDVSDGAMEWFLAVSEADYTDAALEAQLLALLADTPAQTASFTLAVDANGRPAYTDSFLTAASCGVRTFYAKLSGMLLQEWEAMTNAQ